MKAKSGGINLEKEKLEIIKCVTSLKDDTAFQKLRLLREQPKKTDWWTEISEEERAAIDKGLEDIKAGRVTPLKEARKLYEKWL